MLLNVTDDSLLCTRVLGCPYRFYKLICAFYCFDGRKDVGFMSLYGIGKCLDFVEVTLRVYLVIGERRREVVAIVELFDGLIVRMYFLGRNAEYG